MTDDPGRPEVMDSVDVKLHVEVTDDDRVPYRARVNEGAKVTDYTALEAIRKALNNSDEFPLTEDRP